MTERSELAELLALYARWGWHNYDEDLAQAEHALQTAALAEASGASDAIVGAALLHDVGHLLALDGRGAGAHERVGADYLDRLFPAEVTGPVTLHVEAKRYLCATERDYAGTLSTGSVRSLARQGGPMGPDEVVAFEHTPGWEGAVALRRWDDSGKTRVATSRTVESYRPLLASLVTSAGR
jgi:predicted HD phosphohydrolase